jgi:hypothetical protein
MQKHLLTATAALCLALATIAQAPTTGLVAYWPMNGNFSDLSSTGVSGTNFSATATTNNAGAVNTAMNFTNANADPLLVNQYATLPINAALNFSGTQNFTVCFAFYTNPAYVHPGGLFDNNLNYGGYGIWWWNNGGYRLQFNYRNNSIASNVITLGTWVHATAVRNNGTISIYLNGVLNNSTTEGTQTPSYPGGSRFGTFYYSSYSPPHYNGHNGKLDEMRIYNRALTAAEITQTYNAWFNAALPVQLTSFTATKSNNTVLLNWQTQYEQNSSHFNVQRSSNGVNFTTIGSVQSAGTANAATDYSFTDNTIAALNGAKTIYYRLQQADKDGRTALSSIVTVKSETTDGLLTVMQNPAVNELRLQIAVKQQQQVQLVITNAQGQQVSTNQLTLQQGATYTALPIHQLAAGAYYVTVTTPAGKQTTSFIKQ